MVDAKSVLVLDDERIVGDRLKPALEKEGFDVEVFTESTPALARLSEKAFAVLVTDLRMKGPSGLEVLRHARAVCPATKVIVITAFADEEANREVEALGGWQFVAKPFKTKELLRLVAEATGATLAAR